jgi:hypothetical protein
VTATNKKSAAKALEKKSRVNSVTGSKTTKLRRKKNANELAVSLRRTTSVSGKSTIALSQRSQERLALIERAEQQRDETVKKWLRELVAARKILKVAREKYRESVRDALATVYEKYIEIVQSGYSEEFFLQLRKTLIEAGASIQKNTPNAGLVLRLVWGTEISNAQIHKYVAVINYAFDTQVEVNRFKGWLEKITISGAVEASRLGVDNEAQRKEELQRARILILRLLELRETNPYASLKMLAQSAERRLGRETNLCLMLGTAVRRMDRESDYGDILISAILPPNIGLDIKIIDRWARFIIPRVAEYERELDEVDERRWCDRVEETIWAAEQLDAEKQSAWWAQRQQAALAEDQQEFVKQSKLIKKPSKP